MVSKCNTITTFAKRITHILESMLKLVNKVVAKTKDSLVSNLIPYRLWQLKILDYEN